MRQVDENLAEAQRLLGSAEPPTATMRPSGSPQPVLAPQWQSDSAAAATTVSAQIRAQHATAAALADQTRNLVAEATAVGQDAQRHLAAIRDQWEVDKTALSVMPRTPERDDAIIAAGQRRVLEAADVVQTAAERFDQAAGQVRRATAELPHPVAHVDPKPLPPASGTVCCYIGTEDGDVSVCPKNTDTYTYFDKDGNYVAKSATSGEVTIMHRPGPQPEWPQSCWLPSADADRSICGPGTINWVYPKDGYIITEELGPDGKSHIRFQTPPGPLIP
ncbi:hypothetical protein [Mycobacterium avium]|uniref:hypothetical protein n=1 Tax=Mycobacterium avium TaxID=1764 RepID=UPI00111C711C|nr:hypothetical protein [Mycobacterium avium]